jgi:hypothetical protein
VLVFTPGAACRASWNLNGALSRVRFLASRLTLHWLGWFDALATLTRGPVFGVNYKRALVLIWDHASWHVSQAVQAWIKAHNRHAKQEGGCRLIVCRLPSKSPWLNPIEPKWVHGKRTVVEPARVLSMTDLMQRVCAYYEGELTDPLAQPDC